MVAAAAFAVAVFPPTAHAPAASAAAPRGQVTVLRLKLPWAPSVTRDVWVYRPAVADSKTLPVLYFLHGVPGSAVDPFRAGLATSLDNYFAAGNQPFVVAAPDGNGVKHADSEWADSADGSDRVETFVTRVVIPAVEGSNRRDAAHRAVAGFSMGGYGAMNLAMRHRSLFGQAVSIAGYFHVDDPSGVFAGKSSLIRANTPSLNVARARGLHVMLVDGRQDHQAVVAGQSQSFAGQLRAAGIHATLSLPNGGHTWRFVASQFTQIEQFLDSRWSG